LSGLSHCERGEASSGKSTASRNFQYAIDVQMRFNMIGKLIKRCLDDIAVAQSRVRRRT
jgi:hypothetical protein